METTTLNWLLDPDASDPAIRWQVMRDLVPDVHSVGEIAAERAKITAQGWGARLLSLQDANGTWAGGACFPGDFRHNRAAYGGHQPWTSTLPTLQTLYEFGIDPNTDQMRKVIVRVEERCKWEHAGQAFFDGEVEPCINGRVVTLGAYFGVRECVEPVVARLLSEQLEDGGWNCEAENGSVRSSFDTTINVLEGLLEYERALSADSSNNAKAVVRARRRGEEYLLERQLSRRKSTCEIVKPDYLQLSFPPRWHYDVLRSLDYFRAVGNQPDPRMSEAMELLKSKQRSDGIWLLENAYPGRVHFEMEEVGQPSRWNTLRGLRVLKWWYEQR